MKRYITWTRKKINDNRYEDPNTNDRVNIETNGGTVFTETSYQIADGRFISIVEYGDDETEANIEYFRTLDPDFNFTFITEAEANTLLVELTDDTGGVTVSNFIFSDTRVLDII